MHDHRSRSDPPPAWGLLLEDFLAAPPALSRRLWSVFERQASLSERYILENCLTEGYAAAPEQVFQRITPARLLKLTLEVAPETGRVRDPQVRALEATILARMRPPVGRPPWYA